MMATERTLKVFLKNGTVVFAKIPSSMVLRNAQGRLALATPGLDDACEVAVTCISLATGKATSQVLLVSGPAIASTLSSPASLRSALVACAGRAASS